MFFFFNFSFFQSELLKNPEDDVRVYYTEGLSAAAIVKFLPGIKVPYLDKFVVDPRFRRLGLAELLMNRLLNDYPEMFWRSREANPINIFYRQHSDGTFSDDKWRVFWVGKLSVDQVAPLIKVRTRSKKKKKKKKKKGKKEKILRQYVS